MNKEVDKWKIIITIALEGTQWEAVDSGFDSNGFGQTGVYKKELLIKRFKLLMPILIATFMIRPM